jgi:hypothetical protein
MKCKAGSGYLSYRDPRLATFLMPSIWWGKRKLALRASKKLSSTGLSITFANTTVPNGDICQINRQNQMHYRMLF